MPTSTQCYTPIKGRVLRVVKLNDCGVPVTGTGSGVVVATGFTKIAQKAQYDKGSEHLVRTADALMCVNEKDPDILKRLELAATFCLFDPGLIVTTVTGRLLTYSSPPTGTGFAVPEGALTNRFSLEVWQRVSGAAACNAAGLTQYVYNAWPNLGNGQIGNYDIAENPSSLELTAESRALSPLWSMGNQWLGSGAVSAVIPDHWLQNLTTVAPPTATCGIADLSALP